MLTLKNRIISLKKIYFYLFCFFIILSHQILFQSYLFSDYFHYDWQSVLSRLIFGKIWFYNNGFSIPWFAPHICCGIPFFADPQSEYFSLTQILFFLFDPLTFFNVLFLIYSIIAFVGSYLLLNKIFNLSRQSSIIGSTLFLFNHYFVFHYLSVHIGWSLFSIVPLFFFFSCLSLETKHDYKKNLLFVIISSLLFALIMHSGGSRIIVEIVFSIYFLTLLHIIRFKKLKIILNISLILLIGLMISSSKIYAAWAFVSNIGREMQPIQYLSVVDFLKVFFDIFFFVPKSNITQHVLFTSHQLSIEELSLNITIVPLLILILFIPKLKNISKDKITIFASLVLFLSFIVIILLGFSQTKLGSLVQKLPVITSDWVVFRMYAPFVILFCVLSAFMFEKISFQYKKILTIFFVSIVVFQNLIFDRNKLVNIFNYSPKKLLNYDVTRENVKNFKIEKIMSILDEDFQFNGPKQHDFFLENKSIQFCYYSILGYNLEYFIPFAKDLVFNYKIFGKFKSPIRNNKNTEEIANLLEGDPFFVKDGSYNFINPACFLNPNENDCKLNYFFKENNKIQLEKFLKYEKFEFKHSKIQKIFNLISIVMFVLSIIGIFIIIFYIKKTPYLKR